MRYLNSRPSSHLAVAARGARVTSLVVIASIFSIHCLAAVPVAVSTFGGSDKSLSAAVSETLLTELARSPEITVVESRDASNPLRARYTIVGSCLSLDSMVIINARIVDTHTGGTLPGGGDRVTGPRGEVLSLVDGLAARLAARISGGPMPVTQVRPLRPEPRESLPSEPAPAPTLAKPRLLDADDLEIRSRQSRDTASAIDRRERIPDPDVDVDSPSSRRAVVYTSLIIDTRGFGIERSMSPRIRTEEGEVVWAGGDANPDFVIDRGIVAYARSMREAQNHDRAGEHPLVLRAVGRHGDNFRSDPLISRDDADYLVSRGKRDGFLKKFNVIFITD